MIPDDFVTGYVEWIFSAEGTALGGVKFTVTAIDGFGVETSVAFSVSSEYPAGKHPEIDVILGVRLASIIDRVRRSE